MVRTTPGLVPQSCPGIWDTSRKCAHHLEFRKLTYFQILIVYLTITIFAFFQWTLKDIGSPPFFPWSPSLLVSQESPILPSSPIE